MPNLTLRRTGSTLQKSTYCHTAGYLQDCILLSAPVPMRGAAIPSQVIESRRKESEVRDLWFLQRWRALSPLCVVSYGLETSRGSAVTYVGKAFSLAKKLIKLLTIIPTKPHLRAIQQVCTKQSEGMQASSCPPFIDSWLGCLMHL